MKAPDSFVPLTSAAAAPPQREFRVAILNGHDHSATTDASPGPKTGFHSLEAQHSVALSGGASGEKKFGEPRVTLQREGDRITHLRIQCTCGQIIDLACVYDAPPAAP
jgi:hypothetical protein